MGISKFKYVFLFHVILLLIFLIINSSCSSEEGRKVLSIFFDGVPQNGMKKQATDSVLVNNKSKHKNNKRKITEQMFYHPPYQKRGCDKCHNLQAGNKLIKKPPELCYSCHDNFKNQFAVLHGPVASGFCTQCHNPHLSKFSNLLKRKGQNLCLYCHEKKDVLRNEVHEDIGNSDCTECHNPHGGEDRFLL